MKKIPIVLFAGVSICLISCETLNAPGEMEYKNSVYLKLRAGSDIQQLYVYNSLPLEYEFKDPPPFTNSDEVIYTNASITVSDGISTFDKFELAYTDTFKTRKCYQNIEPLNILPDKIYSISVQSNGQTVTGKVMTPGDFDILEVRKEEENDIYHRYKLSWSKCYRARYYTLTATYFGLYPTFPYYKDGKLTCDTVYSSRKAYSQEVGLDSLADKSIYSQFINISAGADSVTFEVEAFDLSTYNYQHKGIRKVNIENGYGLLGASTVKTIKIRLR